MGSVFADFASPIVELHIRIHDVGIIKSGTVAIEIFCKDGKAFVYPGGFVEVAVPVNHVLEFMRENVRVAIGEIGVGGVDDEQLVRVGILMRLRRVFVYGGKVAAQRVAQITRVEDVDMRVVIYAGSPLAAEKFSIGRVNFVFEGLREGVEFFLRERDIILHPKIGVRRHGEEGRVNLETLIRIHVGHPEFQMVAFLIGSAGDDSRKSAKVLQAAGEIHQIIFRDDRLFQRLQRIQRRRRFRSGNFRRFGNFGWDVNIRRFGRQVVFGFRKRFR